ncbi:hypothetical protein IAD21_03733 [Abditibacteriota bacterium]|nr:hypothetical protein IAD21_03733 [Abditibacteriota bacterium]
MPDAIVGRPRGYDEPIVTRHFDLPESLNSRLVKHSKRIKKPAVRIVQDALERALPAEGAATPREDHTTEPQNEQGSSFDFQRGLEATLRSVLSDVLVESVPVPVDRMRRRRLQELASKLGFANEQELARDLIFRALENPEATRAFLFSRLE